VFCIPCNPNHLLPHQPQHEVIQELAV
jgi:hypothetical protein